MRINQKVFTIALATFLIVPQLTFAAWWNPRTWNFSSWFRKTPPQIQEIKVTPPVISAEIPKISADKIVSHDASKSDNSSPSGKSITPSLQPKPKQTAPISKEAQPSVIKIYTLPNGAVVDGNGNVIQQAPLQTTIINTASDALTITLGGITTTDSSAHLEWDTNKPTNSKIFITDSTGNTSVTQSISGLSTHHITNTSLPAGSSFSYMIEAIAGDRDQKSIGSFSTKPLTSPIPVPPKDDILVSSVTVDKTSVTLGVPGIPDDFVRIFISVKYLTKSLSGLTINVITPDEKQNQSIVFGNYQSITQEVRYSPKTVGKHTIRITGIGNTQTITIDALSYAYVHGDM